MTRTSRLFYSLLAVFILHLVSDVKAGTIEFDALGNVILNTGGTLAADGNSVLMGTFASGFDFGANAPDFATTFAAFSTYGMTTIGTNADPNAGQFSDTAVVTGVVGNRLYMWLFNNPTPSAATAWAIITNNAANWTAPADSALSSTIIDSSDPGTFVPALAGAMASATGPNGPALGFITQNANIQMQAVPEPSALVLVFCAASGLFLSRRRNVR